MLGNQVHAGISVSSSMHFGVAGNCEFLIHGVCFLKRSEELCRKRRDAKDVEKRSNMG